MTPTRPTPDTIVLVHGFWVTPRSWEHWIAHYEAKGYRVIAPAYPGFEAEVESLNADPAPVEAVTVPAIIEHIEHIESILRGLPSPPIIIGHSAGGAFTQILLDHGFGAAGVALNSAPTEGVPVVPLSQVRATFPVLRNPANRHRAVRYDFAHWNYAFTNTVPEAEARALYERYAVPVSGRILFEIEVTATPCRHGPPLSRPVVGEVVGFALDGLADGTLWISGDTEVHRGLLAVARRLDVAVAVLHLGAVRFPLTGPVRYTVSARDAVHLCHVLRPRTVVPVHHEGWGHFTEGRRATQEEFDRAPRDVRDAVRWLDPGRATDVRGAGPAAP